VNPEPLLRSFLPVCLAVLFSQLVRAQTTDALSVGRILCPRTGDELEVLVVEGRYPTDAEAVSCGDGWIGELRWEAAPSEPDELRVNRLASLIPLGTCTSDADSGREIEKTCNGHEIRKWIKNRIRVGELSEGREQEQDRVGHDFLRGGEAGDAPSVFSPPRIFFRLTG